MLRDALNKALISELSSAVSHTLTIETCVDLLRKQITDPVLRESLNRVVGRKGSKPLKPTQARSLVASLLGFDNDHQMAAHYKAQAPRSRMNLNVSSALIKGQNTYVVTFGLVPFPDDLKSFVVTVQGLSNLVCRESGLFEQGLKEKALELNAQYVTAYINSAGTNVVFSSGELSTLDAHVQGDDPKDLVPFEGITAEIFARKMAKEFDADQETLLRLILDSKVVQPAHGNKYLNKDLKKLFRDHFDDVVPLTMESFHDQVYEAVMACEEKALSAHVSGIKAEYLEILLEEFECIVGTISPQTVLEKIDPIEKEVLSYVCWLRDEIKTAIKTKKVPQSLKNLDINERVLDITGPVDPLFDEQIAYLEESVARIKHSYGAFNR